jgi:acyl carrier protein
MTTEKTITQIFQTKVDGFDLEKMRNEKLKFLGMDSIQFVNIIITICKEIGISPTELNGNIISMENTFDEFLVNFDKRK